MRGPMRCRLGSLLAAAVWLGLGAKDAAADFVFTKIADNATPIPGGTGNFTIFSGAPVVSGGTVAFFGNGTGFQGGLFLYDGVGLNRVISQGDSLDGKTISLIKSGFRALDGTSLTFQVNFTDGSRGIYVATVPEPSTFVLFVSG